MPRGGAIVPWNWPTYSLYDFVEVQSSARYLVFVVTASVHSAQAVI